MAHDVRYGNIGSTYTKTSAHDFNSYFKMEQFTSVSLFKLSWFSIQFHYPVQPLERIDWGQPAFDGSRIPSDPQLAVYRLPEKTTTARLTLSLIFYCQYI